jgi:hypothetical protein
MAELRISYNPKSKRFLSGSNSHAEQIHNAGHGQDYDDYIRGIIVDKTLYLRTYYPYTDINERTGDEIQQASYSSLYDEQATIKKHIANVHNIKIKKVVYNVTNDLLQGVQLANI